MSVQSSQRAASSEQRVAVAGGRLSKNPHISNRTIFEADNLSVMEGINSKSIDLIYLDPPFNTNRIFTAKGKVKKSDAQFDDIWGDTSLIKGWNDEWVEHIEANRLHVNLHTYLSGVKSFHSDTMYHYLVYMAIRLVEMERILKSNGSFFFHCDTTAGHYIKPMLDILFGRGNFKNEIVWNSDPGAKNNAKRMFGRAHDTIFYYARPKATFNVQYSELDDAYIETWYTMREPDGRRYRARPLNRHKVHEYEFLGELRQWECTRDRMEEYLSQGRILHKSTTPGSKRNVAMYKFYLDESPGKPAQDNWTDVPALSDYSKENTSYPTQKPLALLERIIKSSTNEGDVVLDPFCGCATTLVAAERLNRMWVGIDVEPESVSQLRIRLEEELELMGVHTHRKDIPKRTDAVPPKVRGDIKEFLYETQQGKCNGCQRLIPYELRDLFDLDHIRSRKRGGLDVESNLQLLCRTCNVKKGAGTMAQLLEKLAIERAQGKLAAA